MVLTKTFPDGTTPSIAIVGAGITGLCAGIQLQRVLQLTTYTIFELESDVGGTWLTNIYPGCQSDSPIHIYSYSFAPNYDFSKMLVPQPEIISYLRATAKTYNIYDKIQFQTRVTSMRWNESRKKWTLKWLRFATGEQGESEFDMIIHSAGVLRVPKVPKEFDAFEGPKWHSAKWDHSIDLTEKRVGIVGVAASGAQIIPEIAKKVQSLEVYSRKPNFIIPHYNFFYNKVWKFLFRKVPFFYAFYRAFLYYFHDSTVLLYHKLAWFSIIHRAFYYMVSWLHRFRHFPFDARMRRKLTPEYEIASRHLVLSNDYYPALKRSNVTLHTDNITSIKGRTIETSNGSLRDLDVLILATGFDFASCFPEGYWCGRNDIDIPMNWGDNPETYFGICVPHAPNFFLLWGPNTDHHTITSLIEIQVMYSIRSISFMMEQNIATMEIKQEAAKEFLEYADKRLQKTIYTTNVMPKYLNSKGKCRGFFWGSVTEYWWHLRKLRPELFDILKKEELKNPI